jgi:hypothetical protein
MPFDILKRIFHGHCGCSTPERDLKVSPPSRYRGGEIFFHITPAIIYIVLLPALDV